MLRVLPPTRAVNIVPAAARAMATTTMPRRSARNLARIKSEGAVAVQGEGAVAVQGEGAVAVQDEGAVAAEQEMGPGRRSKRRSASSVPAVPAPRKKRVKPEAQEEQHEAASVPAKATKARPQAERAAELQARKLKAYAQFAHQSPFPDFPHPTPAECKQAHRILASLHGERVRPAQVVAPTNRAGCGDSSSVLDALVRTILSQNTSDRNSTRAKMNMDKVYGGSDKWDAIVQGGPAKLQKAIESGGLSVQKSKAILAILHQAKEKYGVYSLDHLFAASNEDAMREMLSFHGVGPKTASCVLLFCLRRESFAVDTHVHRITGLLGWRPRDCTREEAHAHLDAQIPDEDKYGLHILLVTHGKRCDECKAGGKNLGRCELRTSFRRSMTAAETAEEDITAVKEEASDA